MADGELFEQIDEAQKKIDQAEKEVERLVSRFLDVARKLQDWRNLAMKGTVGGDKIKASPQDGGESFDADTSVPSLHEILRAKKAYHDACAEQQQLVDDATPDQMKWIQSKYPNLRKSGTVSYFGQQGAMP